MPKLNNPTENDLFADYIHQIVPAHGSVDITDEQAAHFVAGQVFTVSEYEGAAEVFVDRNVPVEGTPPVVTEDETPTDAAPTAEAPDSSADPASTAAVTRSNAARGATNAEVTTPPAMEKR